MKSPTRAPEPPWFPSAGVSRHRAHDTDGPPLEPVWLPTAGVDEAARLAVEFGLRASVELRRRPDGESGLFAARPIPAGTSLVHRWHDDYYRGMAGWSLFAVDAIDGLPAAHRALVHRYGLDQDFGAIWGPDEAAAVTTLDNFINHACAPTLGYDAAGDVVARGDLRAGEELTLDYGGFVVNYDERFACRCGARACRGGVSRDDWRAFGPADAWRLPPFVRRRRG